MGLLASVIKPIKYKIEQRVVSKAIPDVHRIEDRKQLPITTHRSHEYNSGGGSTPIFDHSLWNELLQDYVDTSSENTIHNVEGIHLVDYKAMGKDTRFAKYLSILEEVKSVPDGAANLAFWMNAYNALCIKVIITYQPENSILQISSLNPDKMSVWDVVAGKVAGQEVTLNQIEHVHLRSKWAEPTLHACIVCASASCPNLRAQAFSEDPDILRAQMKDQMVEFTKNHTKGVHWAAKSKTLSLSRIFLWFEKDFGKEGIRSFLLGYAQDEAVKKALAKSSTVVHYFVYDWNLNKKSSDS